jgi:hypothetical protein
MARLGISSILLIFKCQDYCIPHIIVAPAKPAMCNLSIVFYHFYHKDIKFILHKFSVSTYRILQEHRRYITSNKLLFVVFSNHLSH